MAGQAEAGRVLRAAGILGFALGGFFDGIVLHQLLQWHHLLSLVPGEAFRSQRVQLLADGLFHLLMYVIALAGLWLLWRRRDGVVAADPRAMLGAALVGFAAWHIVDAVLFHWVLALHHIRLDVDDPIAWDIGWLAVFGLGVLAAGLLLLRRRGSGGGAAALGLALVTVGLGAGAALPPRGIDTALVIFAPGTGPARAFAAAGAAATPVLWADRSGLILAVSLDRPGAAATLRRHGALLVTRSALLAGCLAASR